MKALVLGVGGVVLNDPVPDLLRAMSKDSSHLERAYNEIAPDFWSGKMNREVFGKH